MFEKCYFFQWPYLLLKRREEIGLLLKQHPGFHSQSRIFGIVMIICLANRTCSWIGKLFKIQQLGCVACSINCSSHQAKTGFFSSTFSRPTFSDQNSGLSMSS